tara:strand:- start:142 stop:1092 length:951 start_codon:yes stop_codon:yes gene_type:complete
MESIHAKKDYDSGFIQSLIDNRIEENQNIEFKSSGALDKSTKKKDEISRDVSSMANSNGGIIIYGLAEKEHVADHLSFIDGNFFTKESLEQIISTKVYRVIPGLKIFPIRFDDDILKTVYVVQIPESIDAPHMSADKRFYVRNNFERLMMDEYQVRNLYSRKSKGKLIVSELNLGVYFEGDNVEEDQVVFNIRITIENVGDSVVKEYRLNALYTGGRFYEAFSWRAMDQGKHYSYTYIGDWVQFTNENPPMIFPNEQLTILDFDIKVNRAKMDDFVREFDLKAVLYFNDDKITREFKNKETLIVDFRNRNGVFEDY